MKSVLITGAARNTGLGMARLFARRGWAVLMTSRSEEQAVSAAKQVAQETGMPCYGFGHDIGDTGQTEALFQQVMATGWMPDSVILNAAAQGLDCDPLTVPIEEWAAVIRANVVGNFDVARTFAREMVRRNAPGTIVFLGSITYRNCNPRRSSYNASKGAILSMTKALAIDLGGYGIRVNCLMPGPIHTERYDVLTEEVRRMRDEAVPIGHVSTAEDIAKGTYFLASEESGNATGTGLIIDGGMDSLNAGRY